MVDLTRLAAIARQREGAVDADRDAAERARFLDAARRPASRRWPYAALAAAAAVALLLAFALSRGDDAVLAVTVEGATLADEGFVRAADAPATLRFSDGSTLVLAPRSSGRVVELREHGARISLERGSVEVDVRHLPDARWSLAAGPYVVAVTGTRFTLSWDAARDDFALTMTQGSVVVRGPKLDLGLVMKAGQNVHIVDGSVQLDAAHASAQPSAVPTLEPTSEPTGEPSAVAGEPGAQPRRVSWSQLIAQGDYQRVLAEADARGVDAVLSGGSLEQVVALGDAARYGGRGALARRSLTVLRERFAGTAAAQTAAFLLGRMSEGAPSAAIGWYDRYLSEVPGGPYAGEALGRKLHLLSTTNRTAAKRVAQQYLASYPRGAYAALAKQLLGN